MTANKSNLRAHSTPLMKNSAGVISARQKANKEVLFCKDWCVQELFWNLDVLFVQPLYVFFFHVPFWLIVRLENVSFDDYLLALEIESSFQRRRLLECKILDSLSLETEEVGRCMSMMLGNPCDFIRNLWLLSGLLTPKINQSTLNFRKELLPLRNSHPALWLANRWPILPVLRVCLFSVMHN